MEPSFPCESVRRKITTVCLSGEDTLIMEECPIYFSRTSEGHKADKLPSKISQDGNIPSGQRERIQKSFLSKRFQRQLLQISEEVNWEWEIL